MRTNNYLNLRLPTSTAKKLRVHAEFQHDNAEIQLPCNFVLDSFGSDIYMNQSVMLLPFTQANNYWVSCIIHHAITQHMFSSNNARTLHIPYTYWTYARERWLMIAPCALRLSNIIRHGDMARWLCILNSYYIVLCLHMLSGQMLHAEIR